MPRHSPYVVLLSDKERVALEQMAGQYTSPYYQVIRSKIVLLAAEGLSNKEIAQRLDIPRPVASRWRKRFFEASSGTRRSILSRAATRFSPSGGRSDQSSGSSATQRLLPRPSEEASSQRSAVPRSGAG